MILSFKTSMFLYILFFIAKKEYVKGKVELILNRDESVSELYVVESIRSWKSKSDDIIQYETAKSYLVIL